MASGTGQAVVGNGHKEGGGLPLVEQLRSLQVVAYERDWIEAFRYLGREVVQLESTCSPVKRRRKRGRWVRLAATGERWFMDEELLHGR